MQTDLGGHLGESRKVKEEAVEEGSPRNYLVTREGTRRTFTVAQVQALCALYDAALQLVRGAGEPYTEGTGRPVMEKDFVAMCKALEQVRKAVRQDK